MTEEAWKQLSNDFNWSETLLEKWQDKVDWNAISENIKIQWTIPMIQKFKNRIDWDKFSRYAETETLTENVIDAFKDKWNWSELSENSNLELTFEFLDKYADRLDWEKIISHWNCSLYNEKGIEFYEKYKDFIAASTLQNTRLWDEIVCQRKKQLIAEIAG